MQDKMLKLNLKDSDAMQDFFFGDNVDYDFIYANIYRCIERGILSNKDSVQFASITFDNGEQIDLECNREEYEENLTNCMRYYEKVEQYERCAMVKKLIEKIK
jgi:hypothetical protein